MAKSYLKARSSLLMTEGSFPSTAVDTLLQGGSGRTKHVLLCEQAKRWGRGVPPTGTAPLEGGGGSRVICVCAAEGTALEMTLSPDPTVAVPAPPPPPPVPRPLAAWVVARVVESGAQEVEAAVETGRRSGRSSSMSWLCVSTCVGRPPPPMGGRGGWWCGLLTGGELVMVNTIS